MGSLLDQYREVAPPGTVEFLKRLGRLVEGKRMLHVNSTRYGGGVAEILHRLIPLLEEIGVHARWEVMTGSEPFYRTTKSFHNALQGMKQHLTADMYDAYLECNRENAKRINLEADVAMIHDPQPAALIDARPRGAKWIWRCHIDISTPQRTVWQFLRPYVVRYDAAVVSLPKFSQRLPIPQFLVYPSIDPLSDKNRELTREEIHQILDRLGVPRDKPILLQVSRFDRFKDPVGVVQAYRMVKKSHDCRLVLAGGTATDDPEGAQVLAEVQEAVGTDPDVHILLLPPTAHIEINALQRAATIVLQKSIREGFGLTVAEALWKGKPVIGGATGGIMIQIIPGQTGYTVYSPEGAAFYIRRLLNEPDRLAVMGRQAKEYARHRFLITRHVQDYLGLILHLARQAA
ncbi:glycosyltransferase [Nitrospira sp. NS4]|uniref:glycosyltransferase n=1 Tax=Nitrospira sp. NS4 TaxID=3414498 RepID=UPI003C2F5114